MPKFMLILGANADTESGRTPKTEEIEAMHGYSKNLIDASVMVAGEGLLPSSRGAKLTYSPSAEPSIQRGAPGAPLGEPQNLVSGWWMLNCENLDEAIGWAKNVPIQYEGSTIEVRQVASFDDFGDVLTEEQKKAAHEMRAKLEGK